VRVSPEFRLLVRDPVAGGSFEEWPARLVPDGVMFTQSHPPARRLEVRFLLPGAFQEARGEAEVLHVERSGESFHVRARLVALDEAGRDAVARLREEP
jgi:hypothetical protein